MVDQLSGATSVALPRPLHWRLERLSKRISRRGLYPFLERELAALAPGSRVLAIDPGGPVNALLDAHARRGGLRVALAAVPLMALAVAVLPAAWALGSLTPTHSFTTGYVVSTRR